jgi:hypothetical protein
MICNLFVVWGGTAPADDDCGARPVYEDEGDMYCQVCHDSVGFKTFAVELIRRKDDRSLRKGCVERKLSTGQRESRVRVAFFFVLLNCQFRRIYLFHNERKDT